jgi:hypothetical protein
LRNDEVLGRSRLLRAAVAAGTAALVSAPALAAAASPGARYWPVLKVMRAIDGKPVSVAGRSVRIEADTTLCSGNGRSIRVRGIPRWRLFRCTHTTITRRGLDRDLEFDVRVLDARRIRITNPAWVPDAR